MAESVPGFESNWELVTIFENLNPKKSTSKHHKSEDNIPGRMVQNIYLLLQEIDWEQQEELHSCWSE